MSLAVLIIDDNQDDRELYMRSLERADDGGYTFICAENGNNALDMIQSYKPDCVLLDYNMPGQDGLSVLGSIRSWQESPPVIMMTNHGDENVAASAIKSGAYDYISKSDIMSQKLRVHNTIRSAVEHKMMSMTIERQKKNIEENEKILRAVIDNMEDCVITTDCVWNILSFNLSCESVFGYKSEEMMEKRLDELIKDFNRDGWVDRLCYGGGDRCIIINREFNGIKPSGALFPLTLSICEAKVGDKKIYSCILRDISKQKEQEQRRAELVSQLKESNMKLKEEKIMAEAANRAKSEFLANISHEIRTPMNGIIGISEMLSLTPLNDAQRDMLNTIQTSGNMLLYTINDILDLSKIQAGELTLDPHPTSLDELIKNIVQLYTVKASDKGLQLTMLIDADVPLYIEADSLRLSQVITNLVSNAIKFTEKGSVTIKVKNHGKSGERDIIYFEVADTGIGISKDKCSVIFDKFIQEDSSTTRKYGGTGLGLSITRELLRMMGGKIEVDSVKGKGSTFFFEAPFKAIEKDDAEKQKICEAVKGKRVLIVENTNANLERLSGYFSGIEADVATASEGDVAMAELVRANQDNQPYDLLIADHAICDMSGTELSKVILRDQAKYGSPKLILMAELGKKTDFSGMESNGYAMYVIKPVLSDALLKCVYRAFNNEKTSVEIKDENSNSFPKFNANILVVEDDKINQRMITGVLEVFGCGITIVGDGLESLDILKAKHDSFDMILMDWQMPNMDGLDATRLIRSESWGKDKKIIMLTANAMSGDSDVCLKAGANGYISKPMQLNDIRMALEKYLPEKKQKTG